MANRKIAILLGHSVDDGYGSYITIIDKLTDFVEVTEEAYKILVNQSYIQHFKVIEIPINTQEFVDFTVAGYLKQAQLEEEKRLKELEVRKKKAAEASRKRKQREEEQEKKKLEELIQKHGIPKIRR